MTDEIKPPTTDFDDATRQAMARWPNVPDVYGWLALDRRGRWRLVGEIVAHSGLVEAINRNYRSDARGAWFFQNGPQRVFVKLETTPWVLRAGSGGRLETHTGLAIETPLSVFLVESGLLAVAWHGGVGAVDDRDLPEVLDGLRFDDGRPASEEAIDAIMRGVAVPLRLELGRHRLEVAPIARADLEKRFGFVGEPVCG